MSLFDITWVDALVVVILLASTAFAVWRGFIRETLSIVAWAAAAFATLYFGPVAAALLHGIASAWLVVVIAYLGVFLLVLIPLSFMSHRFAETVHNSPVGALDRALGLAFGVVRGLAIVAIAYLIFSLIVPVKTQPHWLRDAQLFPLIQSSSEVLLSVIPEQRGSAATEQDHTAQNAAEAPKEKFKPAAEKTDVKKKKKTYGARDRRALDKLIEATGSGGQ